MKINRAAIDSMIGTEQEVTVKIGAEEFRFKGKVLYDSLRTPGHRLEAYDLNGNAVFIKLEDGGKTDG